MMSIPDAQTLTRFEELKPGDRITVEHKAAIGQQPWKATTGTVVRTERRQGEHRPCHPDDKTFSRVILIELPDGELSAITMDEFTVLRRA
jgi:hypothetical protein